MINADLEQFKAAANLMDMIEEDEEDDEKADKASLHIERPTTLIESHQKCMKLRAIPAASVTVNTLVILAGDPCQVLSISRGDSDEYTFTGTNVLTGRQHEQKVKDTSIMLSFDLVRHEYPVVSVRKQQIDGYTTATFTDLDHEPSPEPIGVPMPGDIGTNFYKAWRSNVDVKGPKKFTITLVSAPMHHDLEAMFHLESVISDWKEVRKPVHEPINI